MVFRKDTLEEAAREIQFRHPALATFLKECAKTADANDRVELLDRNEYFASILWQKCDVKDFLIEERGYLEEEITDEMVDSIIAKIRSDYDIENCEPGWEVIGAAVDDYERENVPER